MQACHIFQPSLKGGALVLKSLQENGLSGKLRAVSKLSKAL